MKKIIYALILVFVLTCGSMITNASVSQKPTAISEIIGRPLLDYSEYQKLNTDEIDSLKIIRFTEGGVSEREIKDKTEIYKFQGYLKDIKLLKETGAGKIYLAVTFAFFTEGIEEFDDCFNKGLFDKLYTTNLSYIPSKIKDKAWFEEVDLSKKIAELIKENNYN